MSGIQGHQTGAYLSISVSVSVYFSAPFVVHDFKFQHKYILNYKRY